MVLLLAAREKCNLNLETNDNKTAIGLLQLLEREIILFSKAAGMHGFVGCQQYFVVGCVSRSFRSSWKVPMLHCACNFKSTVNFKSTILTDL